jgi:hypothetical protein
MSDYFATVREGLGDAVERRQHRHWYARLRVAHGRALAVVLTALVVTTPAVGAVSDWFGFGRPDATPRQQPGSLFGVVKPGGSRLLPIRVADPQGGPAWGLRLVRTDRGNTCVQLGRVEDGKLGSLGIGDAWNNDHEFHILTPNATYADECGSTDAAGYGYLSFDALNQSASANPSSDATPGSQSSGCKLRGVGGPASWPYCPAGSERMIFFGLLGPDATSITYRKPDGELATERTVGGVGAYLLVFTYDDEACHAYSEVGAYQAGCDGIRGAGVSPDKWGAVTKISYRDGRSCSVAPSARLVADYDAFNRRTAALPKLSTQRQRYDRYDRLWSAFLRREHLTARQFDREMQPKCPPVGWVAATQRRVTVAEVATPIHLRVFPAGTYACPANKLHLPDGCNYPNMRQGVQLPSSRVIPVEWSFTARRPVTTTRSWYSWSLQYPDGSGCGGGEGTTTYKRIRAGQTLRYSTFIDPRCHGTYHLTVGYMQDAPPGVLKAGGGAIATGRDGSIVVGRATFTIR